ncbi:unnamed protein product [Urochloa humidicola]
MSRSLHGSFCASVAAGLRRLARLCVPRCGAGGAAHRRLGCIFHAFSGEVHVGGWRGLAMLLGLMEHNTGVLCGGFDIDDVFLGNFLCVGIRFPYELLFASRVSVVPGVAGLATNNMVTGVWKSVSTGGLGFALPVLVSLRSIVDIGVHGGVGVEGVSVRFVCQLVEKSGWILSTTCLSGFFPLWVVLLSGESGLLEAMEATDLLTPGDVMAFGHFQPGRSLTKEHVDEFEVLLVEAIKTCDVPSSEWRSASSSGWLRSPVTRATGRILQGLVCNFYFFQGCLCKIWNVIFVI